MSLALVSFGDRKCFVWSQKCFFGQCLPHDMCTARLSLTSSTFRFLEDLLLANTSISPTSSTTLLIIHIFHSSVVKRDQMSLLRLSRSQTFTRSKPQTLTQSLESHSVAKALRPQWANLRLLHGQLHHEAGSCSKMPHF